MARLERSLRDPTLWFFPLVYAVVAWRIYGNLGLLDNSRLIGGLWSDPVQQSWFLEYWKWSVINGHFSSWTNLMDYPVGFNLFDNPSLSLLAIPAVPLTALFGPIAVLNLLFRLGFFLSALTVFLLLRRVLPSRIAAGLGGMMYAFGPSQVAWAQNWLHFSFVPLPPLMLYFVYRGVTDRDRAWQHGRRLAIATVAEALIDPEFVIETFLAAGLTLVIFLIVRAVRRKVRRSDFAGLYRTGAGFTLAAVIPLGLLAGLILFGRGSYQGGFVALHTSGYTPADILLPSGSNFLTSLLRITVPDYTTEALNGTYIGIPLIVAFAAVTAALRRVTIVRAAATMAVIAWVLSLGNYLSTGGLTPTPVPLPFNLIYRLPTGSSIGATRFTLFLDLGVAVVLAAGINAVITSRRWLALRIPLAGMIAFGVALAAPTTALSSGSTASYAPREVASASIEHLIPNGGNVFTLPYSNGGPIESLLWQSAVGMRFKMMGGYAIRELPPGYPAYGYPEIIQPAVDCLLMAGPPQSRETSCQSMSAARSRLRAFVRHWHVSAILVQLQPGDSDLLRLLDGLYRRRAHNRSVYVWRTETRSG